MKKILFATAIAYHLFGWAETQKPIGHFSQNWESTSTVANLGAGCRIKLDIPKQARLSQGYENSDHRGAAGFSIKISPNFSNNGEWGVDFNCFKTNEKDFQESWKNRSPKTTAKLKTNSGKKIFTNNASEYFIRIQAVNAQGWALTFDDTAGEEEFRTRHLKYCIKNERSAICGSSDIGYLEYLGNRKNIDMQSVTLKILESIEFLEDAPPNQ